MYMYSGTLFYNGIIETIFMETKQGDQVHCIPNTLDMLKFSAIHGEMDKKRGELKLIRLLPKLNIKYRWGGA